MSDNEDIELDLENPIARGPINPDEEYANEYGYSLIVALRGSSCGRQMKRCLFWLSLYHLMYGFPIFFISCYIDDRFAYMNYFHNYRNGSTIIGLLYATSFFALIFGTFTLACVRYWSTMVTNRELLVKLLMMYQVFLFIQLWLIIGAIIRIFQEFSDFEWDSPAGRQIYGFYVTPIVLLFPYLFADLYYGLDVSYLTENIQYGARIEEPEPVPEHTLDLSGLLVSHLCMAAIALPLMAFETCANQAADWFNYVDRTCNKKYAGYVQGAKKRHKAAKSFCTRVTKTVRRYYKDMMKERLARKAAFEDRTPLAGLTDEVVKLKEDTAEARLARQLAERERKDEEMRLEREAREREEAMATELGARKFKDLWTKLGSAGSFQCKLKSVSIREAFVEHIRRQGFHVVFVANPDAGGFEVGVCNIRQEGAGGPWFMARFMAREKLFSAVMKSEDPAIVTKHVKKFALAKVLRIDTSA